MENKSRGYQPAHQVRPIVAAHHMSQFVEQNVVELRLGNLLEQQVRENDNGMQKSRHERRNHFIRYQKLGVG